MQRKMQLKRAEGRECVSVIREYATSHSRYSVATRSHTCFAFVIVFFLTDFRSTKKRDCSQSIEDIKINNVQLLSWSLEATRRTILSMDVRGLVLLPECDQVAPSFLPRIQLLYLHFQSNTFIFTVLAFSVIAIKLPDTDF